MLRQLSINLLDSLLLQCYTRQQPFIQRAIHAGPGGRCKTRGRRSSPRGNETSFYEDKDGNCQWQHNGKTVKGSKYGTDPPGMTMCESPDGTGVNDPKEKPNLRSATKKAANSRWASR